LIIDRAIDLFIASLASYMWPLSELGGIRGPKHGDKRHNFSHVISTDNKKQ